MNKFNIINRQIVKAIGSNRFFWAIIIFMVVQATWIALTGLYPMAFDEQFHLGIIRLYAHHLNPFWSAQPDNSAAFGAVFRDPSYLYHYLMSFPYRLISHFTSDQTIQVLWLRAINVGLFTSGLILFRRVLAIASSSKALINSCLLFFTLIPVMPLLAAQINYDNFLFPLTAIILILTLKLNASLSSSNQFSFNSLLLLGSLVFLTSLVKYAFLPIFAVIFVYLIVRFKQTYGNWRNVWNGLRSSWIIANRVKSWLLIALFILSLSLFTERFGINIVRYHTPVPSCSQVLDEQVCTAYGPWNRDHNYAKLKHNPPISPISYTRDWIHGMWLRLFFAVDGTHTGFQSRRPLLMPAIASILGSAIGLVLLLVYGRRVMRNHDTSVLGLFGAICAGYIAMLWFDQYLGFLHTGRPVAINGRYLLPVLPLLLLIIGLVYQEWLSSRHNLKLAVTAIIILFMIWGGGALTYILRSNDAWYWPNSKVRTMNHAVQSVFKPIMPGMEVWPLLARKT